MYVSEFDLIIMFMLEYFVTSLRSKFDPIKPAAPVISTGFLFKFFILKFTQFYIYNYENILCNSF